MGWDAAIFGTLTVPAGEHAAWLKADANSAKVPHAAKYLSTFEVSGKSVAKTIKALTKYKDPEGLTFLEIQGIGAGETVEVRSFMDEDNYIDNCVTVAAVWAAAPPTATGELYFAGMLTAGFCYKLTVGPSGVALVEVKDNREDKLPLYQEILARVEARVAELDLD